MDQHCLFRAHDHVLDAFGAARGAVLGVRERIRRYKNYGNCLGFYVSTAGYVPVGLRYQKELRSCDYEG